MKLFYAQVILQTYLSKYIFSEYQYFSMKRVTNKIRRKNISAADFLLTVNSTLITSVWTHPNF